MNRLMRGFTIVEVIIVISVLSILSGIVIVSWNGVITSTKETARLSDLKQWSSTFDLYKSRYHAWPLIPQAGASYDGAAGAIVVCLGKPTNTPSVQPTRCGTVTTASAISNSTGTTGTNYTNLETEIKKVSKMPTNSAPDAKSLYRGPFAYISKTTGGSTVTVTAKIVNFFESSTCPNDTVKNPAPPYSTQITGAAGSGVIACEISKDFTYSL